MKTKEPLTAVQLIAMFAIGILVLLIIASPVGCQAGVEFGPEWMLVRDQDDADALMAWGLVTFLADVALIVLIILITDHNFWL